MGRRNHIHNSVILWPPAVRLPIDISSQTSDSVEMSFMEKPKALKMCKSYVSYYRCSTDKQGQSGLGLDAQQHAVEMFIASKGEDARLLASFTEVESGKKDDRPQLAAALAYAKCKKATLIIAKLDRLGRRAAFLMNLRDAGVDFEALDCPTMNTLTLGMMAVFAQHEREQTSQRTKAALAAAKPRVAVNGQKKHPEVKRLGNPMGSKAFGDRRGVNAAPVAANEVRKAMAQEKIEAIRQLHVDGLSVKEIASRTGLNVRLIYRALLAKP
jgi:DNA invertase Pin-like site-specific DNA recombinase